MIRCPKCTGYTRVINSRPTQKSMRRRRRCRSCGHTWTTYELVEDLESLLKSVVDRCEPLRMRLRHIEAEMYQLGKALRSIQNAPKGEGFTIAREDLPRQARIKMWSKLEILTLDQLYGVVPTELLADRFSRTPLALYQQARKRGLTKARKGTKDAISHTKRAAEAENSTRRAEARQTPFASDRKGKGASGQDRVQAPVRPQEGKVDASKEREIKEGHIREYISRGEGGETAETSGSDSSRYSTTVRSGGSNRTGEYPKKG